MMVRIRIFAVIAIAMFALTARADARDIPAGGFTVSDIVAWLQSAGYPTEVKTADDGSSHVMTSAYGSKFGVYLFDCSQGRCGSIQFAAGWNTHGKQDPDRLAAWNRDKRWSRAYADSEHDPWLEMDVDLSPGGTYELLDDEFATYRGELQSFKAGYLTGF